MFFKKEIKNCLKLNEILKIILPDKSLEHVKPTTYFNLNKSDRNDFDVKSDNLTTNLKDILNERLPNFVDDVNRLQKSSQLNLVFNRHEFLKNTLNNFKLNIDNFIDFFGYPIDNRQILIEFSSPNIAKKLHFGNFRSTLTGHCLSNLFIYKAHNIKRINYYGDWGTQFGVLSAAFDKFGNENELKSNAIKHLIDCYVKGTQESELNNEFLEESRKRFALLENSNSDNSINNDEINRIKKQWELFRELSLKEYDKDYKRLGIEFDIIQFESMFNHKAKQLFNDKNLPDLIFKDDGSIYFKTDKKTEEIVIKSDGSTLYLSRDVIAALERKEEFNFDLCYYIVDSSQSKHFKKLKTILKKLNYEWTNQLIHLPIGRINKMSTRQGTARLLDEIIEYSEKLSVQSTKENKNSKVNLQELESTKFDLAFASLITNLLRHKRTTELDFDLDYFTDQSNDQSGISLMYTYSRLCNLKLNSGIDFDLNCELDLDSLDGNESYYLLLLMSKFDEIIEQSCYLLEPRILIDYLFQLKTAINRAYKVYPIKGQSKSCGQTRLLLFHCAQQVYGRSLKLTGINPLERI